MELRDEILMAFAKVPRPADSALTACDCDECRWEVGGLRGKSWARLSSEDWGGDEGGINLAILTPAAFHYFLPGLLRIAIDEPDEMPMLPYDIITWFVVSDRAREETRKAEPAFFQLLTPRQRRAIVEFFRSPSVADGIPPVIVESAISNLMDGTITPYSFEVMDRWVAEAIRRHSAGGAGGGT